MKDKMKYIYLVLTVVVLVVSFVMANSYGFFEYVRKGINPNTIKTANVIIELDDNSSLSISSANAYPVSDEIGRTLSPYVFTVNNIGAKAGFKLKIVNDVDAIAKDGCSNNLLSDASIRYQLIRDGSVISENIFSNLTDRVIDSGYYAAKTDYTYELRIWIDSQAGIEVMNKHFHGKIEVVIG